MTEQPAKPSQTANVGHNRLQCPPVADGTYDALFNGIKLRQQPQVVSKQPRTVPPWYAPRKVVAWVCLLIVIEVAVGHAFQLVAQSTASLAAAPTLIPAMDIVHAPGTCPALEQYAHRGLTIDELHDLQDQLCPALSEPQSTGN